MRLVEQRIKWNGIIQMKMQLDLMTECAVNIKLCPATVLHGSFLPCANKPACSHDSCERQRLLIAPWLYILARKRHACLLQRTQGSLEMPRANSKFCRTTSDADCSKSCCQRLDGSRRSCAPAYHLRACSQGLSYALSSSC